MKIPYIVIALRKPEVESVIDLLKAEGKTTIANWLKANKDKLYGDSREDWKPFMDDKPIKNLLRTDPPIYESSTKILDKLTGKASDARIFDKNKVELFIIDVFALYLQTYIGFANILNLSIYKEKYCLILPFDISQDFPEIHNLFIGAYSNLLGNVYDSYKEGALSRIVGRTDDLTNYIEYLRSQYSNIDGPYPGNVGKARESGLPNVDGPLPSLAASKL